MPLLGLVLGLCILAVPVALGVRADMLSREAIEAAADDYEPAGDPALLACLEQAEKWNARLAGKEVQGKVLPWKRQLEYAGNASNCWIEVPAANIELAVYKGSSQPVLAAGAGLLENTSLPVGGTPSNCVITAHSGMPDERMFDGIRNLAAGDKVCVHTLGRPYAYEVRDAEVVWPSETEHLRVYDEGADMLTLVTCTPYGVNDHRLLVHCTRIPYDPADFGVEGVPPSAYVDNRTAPLAAGLMAAGATAIACRAIRRRSRRRAAAREARGDGIEERARAPGADARGTHAKQTGAPAGEPQSRRA